MFTYAKTTKAAKVRQNNIKTSPPPVLLLGLSSLTCQHTIHYFESDHQLTERKMNDAQTWLKLI